MKFRTAIILTVLAEAFVAFLGVLNYGWSLEGLQATVRFSGRLSLLIFSFIFLLYPGRETALSSILSSNFFFILALAHGIHLMELLTYVNLAEIPLVLARLAGGFIAYAMIFVMPWLHNLATAEKISSRAFKWSGWIYLFYVWFVFFMTYVARVRGTFPNAGGTYFEHVTLISVVLFLLVLKISSLAFSRNR